MIKLLKLRGSLQICQALRPSLLTSLDVQNVSQFELIRRSERETMSKKRQGGYENSRPRFLIS